jgi:DNA-binding transcriptional regulator GbsR (MarR family)
LSEPFEKIFGDTSELRVIESLLPNKNRDFNITELAEESDISRQAAIPVVKKFLQWNLLKIDSKRGNANYYKVNEDSDFIKAFREINNSIITLILGEEELLSRPAQPMPACNEPTSVPLGLE